LYLLEDVGQGGMKMAGVEEMEDMAGMEVMTGIKGMKNDVRKETQRNKNEISKQNEERTDR
jgi:membrane protease subunit (stomatin/prohibitin family)